MEAKSALRIAIVVSCLAVTALGYRNSNGDNSDAVALATRAACTGEECIAVLGQTSRSSFGHEYSFQVRGAKQPVSAARNVIVACKRELLFLGDWACSPKP
jgi:phosphotransacetylase